jgi:hypothetical protein
VSRPYNSRPYASKKRRIRVQALAIAGGLVAALRLTACSDNSPTTTDPLTDSGWDSNGAPTFLKTAPTGAPLGAAAKNTVFACIKVAIPGTGNSIVLGQTAGRQLTQASTPWVQNGNVVISKIDAVPGSMTMPSVFNVSETATTRRLKGNGIPNHPIGVFPIARSSSSYAYYAALPAEGYTNAAEIPVKPYDLDVTLPREPTLSATPICISGLMTGVALTGAAWHVEMALDDKLNVYDPNAALPTDRCFGHPYATEYHYHGYSWKCMDQGTAGKQSPLLGYALDGFGIYGPRGADGKPITNAQLDECHGMVSEVMFNGRMQNVYHYVLNNEYPYSIGCYRGTVQASMAGM